MRYVFLGASLFCFGSSILPPYDGPGMFASLLCIFAGTIFMFVYIKGNEQGD